MTIYQKAIATMDAKDIDHHESDLYLRKTKASEQLVSEHEFKKNVKTFKSNIDGTIWYEIPFAYEPFWKERA